MKQIDVEEIYSYVKKIIIDKKITRYVLKKNVKIEIDKIYKIKEGRISIRKLNELLNYLEEVS